MEVCPEEDRRTSKEAHRTARAKTLELTYHALENEDGTPLEALNRRGHDSTSQLYSFCFINFVREKMLKEISTTTTSGGRACDLLLL